MGSQIGEVMLQVLVNHHREDVATVRRFLDSLAAQTGVDLEVIMCGDGGLRLSEGDLSGYPFPITYAYKPHTGVCNTRNVLMDRSDAEWVMFCDVDDAFVSDGLRSLMGHDADVVGSTYLSEGPNGETVRMERDTIRLHGKAFRSAYLRENGIRFPDEMETGGDMAFLWLAYALTDRAVWVDEPFYEWKWNGSSVTRALPHHHVRSYGSTIRCYTILAHDLERRGRDDLLSALVATLFAMMYVDVTSKEWQGYPEELREAAMPHIEGCLDEFRDVYLSTPEGVRRDRYELMRSYSGLDCGGFDGMLGWVRRRDALIVGCGVVGGNLAEELSAIGPDRYDKYKGIDERSGRYKVAFVCVDTPLRDGRLDVTEVRNAILENDAEVYVVKSTVPVGTVDALREETGRRVVFSPEYYGSTPHANNFDFDFTILGGPREDCVEVVQLLQGVYDGRHEFRMTDAKTAELAKLMENSWIATKVSFCDQFFDLAESDGVCYEELRELFLLDPRVGPSHTFVYRDRPYWSSHCLDKDVPEAAREAPLLQAVVEFNESRRQRTRTSVS